MSGPRRSARFAAVLACGALVAAGCGLPRSGAVSETGPCAQVIPLAQASVGTRGQLTAVKALKRPQIRQVAEVIQREPGWGPRPGQRLPAPKPGSLRRPLGPRTTSRIPKKGCLMVYRGHFTTLPGGAGPRVSGRYLVLLISVRHPAVIKALVIDKLPPAVAHNAA